MQSKSVMLLGLISIETSVYLPFFLPSFSFLFFLPPFLLPTQNLSMKQMVHPTQNEFKESFVKGLWSRRYGFLSAVNTLGLVAVTTSKAREMRQGIIFIFKPERRGSDREGQLDGHNLRWRDTSCSRKKAGEINMLISFLFYPFSFLPPPPQHKLEVGKL